MNQSEAKVERLAMRVLTLEQQVADANDNDEPVELLLMELAEARAALTKAAE